VAGEAAGLGAAAEAAGPVEDVMNAAASQSLKSADSGWVGRAYERMTGSAAAKDLGESYVKATSVITGVAEQDIKKGLAFTPEGKKFRELATSGKQAREELVTGLTQDFNALEMHADDLENLVIGAQKRGEIRKQMTEGMEDDAYLALRQVGEDNYGNWTREMADKPGYYNDGRLKVRIKQTKTYISELNKAYTEGDKAAMYVAADNYNRIIGQEYKALKNAGRGDITLKQTGELIATGYEDMRAVLRDENLFGKVGSNQRVLNDAWNEMLTTAPFIETGTRGGGLLKQVATSHDGLRRIMTADVDYITKLVNGMGTARVQDQLPRLQKYLGDRERLLLAIKEARELQPHELTQLERAIEATRGIKTKLDRSMEVVSAQNQLEDMLQSGNAFNQAMGGSMGPATLSGLGFMVAGPVGAAIGLGAGGAINAGRLIKQIGILERLGGQTSDKLRGSFAKFLGTGQTVAERAGRAGAEAAQSGASVSSAAAAGGVPPPRNAPIPTPPRPAGAPPVERVVPPIGGEAPKRGGRGRPLVGPAEILFDALRGPTGGPAAPPADDRASQGNPSLKQFRQMTDQLDKSVQNLPQTMERMSANLATLRQAAPKVADAMVATSVRGLQFLQGKVPKPLDLPLPAALRRPFVPSDSEMAEFNRYARAVNAPLSVLDDMARGELSFQAVEALQAVYPQLHQQMVQEAVLQLTEATDAVPYAKKLQLAILMDAPLDETFTGDFLRFAQVAPPEGAGQGQPASAPGGRTNTKQLADMDRGGRMATAAQQTEEVA
jgi:hypothetical protein